MTFATEPMRLGSSGWSGNRVHRVTRSSRHFYAPCGVLLRHTFTAAPADVHYPLCSKCFTADERHEVIVVGMERS